MSKHTRNDGKCSTIQS